MWRIKSRACGSDSKSSSESVESTIKKKDVIVIYQHKVRCFITDKENFARIIDNTFEFSKSVHSDSLESLSKDTTQFCQNYERTSDYTTCF